MPTSPRLYVDMGLSPARPITLDEAASNYLLRVLRLGLGGEVRLFNGRDGEWRAVIEAVGARRVEVRVVETLRPAQVKPAPGPILVFAPVKKDATDLIIEKATELGVRRIAPVLTERTQTRTLRLDRLRKIALEATEQTERLDLPVIDEARLLMRVLDDLPPGTAIIFCDEDGGAPPILETLKTFPGKEAAVLIGPEGGFTPSERALLKARADVFAVSLGPRILRAETAVIAALTLWQAVCGDWR